MNRQLSYKILALALLALILAYALSQVTSKVYERQSTRNEAVRSIADQYAREQQLVGPLLHVKCSETHTKTSTNAKGETVESTDVSDCSRILRPVELRAQGNLDVSERYRGIFKARVYLAGVKLHARLPAYHAKSGQTIEAVNLVFGVSDPRGIKLIKIKDGLGRELPAQPGTNGGTSDQGFHVAIHPQMLEQGFDVDADLEIAGSARFDVVPLAQNNDISLTSTWPHPSFVGEFLPETRNVETHGFNALWRINDFATGGQRVLTNGATAGWYGKTLGVSLIDPIDAYTQTDRAVRYGFLFVLLTLGGFFLFELVKARPVHPLQYLLIGFAVVLFFLLLLALSEHVAFIFAYLVAAGACVLLITSYSRTLIGSWKGAATLGFGYSLLYFGLYSILASEDYALLMGAWLIFGLLALAMYLTRRVDWNTAGMITSKAAVAKEEV